MPLPSPTDTGACEKVADSASRFGPGASTPIHLAIFIRSLHGYGGGGAERSIATLASELAEQGHQVDLLCARLEGEYLEKVSAKVRCIDLAARNGLFALPLLLRNPRLLRTLAPIHFGLNAHWTLGALPGLDAYLREEQPEAMLSVLTYSNITAVLAREIAGVKTRLVLSERNTLSKRCSQPGLTRRWTALPDVVRRLYPRADVISAVSTGVATDLAHTLKIPSDEIRVTYNPVVNADLRKLMDEPVDHHWLLPGAPPVILGVGSLDDKKDFETLIRAFAEIRSKREARLIILGEGGLRPELEALVRSLGLAKDAELPGFSDNPFAYMARASVFALSSRYEGLPGVLIQALACGCPVVSTDCLSGPREILEDGELGELVPVGSVTELARAIGRALDDPIPAAQLRERADFFTTERATARYLDLLQPDE